MVAFRMNFTRRQFVGLALLLVTIGCSSGQKGKGRTECRLAGGHCLTWGRPCRGTIGEQACSTPYEHCCLRDRPSPPGHTPGPPNEPPVPVKHSMEERFGRSIMNLINRFKSDWSANRNSANGYKAAYGSPQMTWLHEITQRMGGRYGSRSRNRKYYVGPSTQRKEYRQLSRDERRRFHEALRRMMTTNVPGTSPPVSQYHFLVEMHQRTQSPAAHEGPAFTPWHRIYLLICESVLQSHDPSVTIPYWDSTLDRNLPNSRDTILFSDRFLGDPSGQVTSGPFASWPVSTSCSGLFPGGTLTRDVASVSAQALYQDSDIAYFNTFNNYPDFFEDTGFEILHGGPHVWVGGHMGLILCSPSDPIFWMHHAFVDRLWEDWRQNAQTTNLATDYPATTPANHGANDPMRPFTPLNNIDGLDPFWTTYFRYNSRPVTCSSAEDCGRYLWCFNGRCMSKVRDGGDCSGFPVFRTEPCECGECRPDGSCRIVTQAQQDACNNV